ncbi:MAG: ribonuclease HI family protein [bacterium]|nr:ribonuclease HI family protein [bacterium]
MRLNIYTDGGARGNPGPAGIGVAIFDEQFHQVASVKKYLGEKTNNQAEYEAVIAALERAVELKATELRFFLDSELVVRQLGGQYKIKNGNLAPLAGKVLSLKNRFSSVTFSHIPREKNQLADALENQAIDEALN